PADLNWDLGESLAELGDKCTIFKEVDGIVTSLAEDSRAGDQILVMSNGGFQGIHAKLLKKLK
ncbi:MAG: UDP-N-acetylmuramate:L-alanyl-gamma-D-glutamyl-meso-diaminopimelate ligase, partial [Gammaproteobacteria bacterium]|nr:UDP-N-acetylmuramate:L-alanyl-gamma-D-glutamyl-meso-diaminopimelate ligase [Gammaproteobacteria bacterium]